MHTIKAEFSNYQDNYKQLNIRKKLTSKNIQNIS